LADGRERGQPVLRLLLGLEDRRHQALHHLVVGDHATCTHWMARARMSAISAGSADHGIGAAWIALATTVRSSGSAANGATPKDGTADSGGVAGGAGARLRKRLNMGMGSVEI